MKKKPVWIAGIARGHNAGVCLLKDGEVIFAIEEERLTRQKYDGGPYASMVKILEYTDKLDWLVIAHTQNLQATAGKVDFSGMKLKLVASIVAISGINLLEAFLGALLLANCLLKVQILIEPT